MGVLLLGVTRAAACGGGSNGFEQEMGPLLLEQARSAQEFDGVIDPIFQEFSSTGNMATARAFAQRREETNRTHLDFVRIAAGWEALEPPTKAEAFHILALLMINLKLESLAHLVTVADSAAEIGQLNPILPSEASAQWAAALELWPKGAGEHQFIRRCRPEDKTSPPQAPWDCSDCFPALAWKQSVSAPW